MGTQDSLICGPAQFNEFLLPWIQKFIRQGHDHGLQVILHSCGSIHPVIEPLIGSGVNCLHLPRRSPGTWTRSRSPAISRAVSPSWAALTCSGS
ncbi:MAG: uroporphyrinogen decarboxylase family protein [Kiritimatiellia bacterium]